MQDQFRHRPGTNLVSGNKYVLQDASTGRDLQPDVEFHKMVRAGQTLSMTMIFPGNWSQSGNLEGNLENDRDNVCPKCLHPQAVNNTDMDITCGNAQCGFIYRRIQDFSNTSDDQLDVWLKQNDTHAIQDEEPLPLVTDSLSEDAQNIVAERYDLNGPEVFKRVRFITRWEDLEESRKGFSCTVGGIGFWRASHEGWCGMAYLQVLVLVMVQIREMKLIASRENTLHTKMKMCLYFAGCDKRNSIPVLVVFAESAVQRKRVRKVLGRLSAFTDSRLRLLVVDPVEFLADEARWERIKLRKTTILSHEAKRVAQGITNRRNAS
ncbi:hypothetical protein TruAng_001717 [Truncatella angustata]|nr:hypothetical protein TruAng_001717 [Truncatella angustata]